MPKRNLNIVPYNIDYDPKKKYRMILFKPSVALQARELSEIMMSMLNYSRQTMDTIYKNGTVVDGCPIFIDSINKQIHIGSGTFYYDGAVHIIEEQNPITYTGTGIEKFGFKLKEEIIGAQLSSGVDGVDESLLDNAGGTTNYGNPGADRLKVDFEFVKIPLDTNGDILDDGNTYFIVWEMKDGVLTKSPTGAEYTSLGDNLARRTYDESGHYIVNGMELSLSENDDENLINVEVGAGKAYVKGYEINFIAPQRIEAEKANDTTDLYKIDNEILNNTNGKLTPDSTTYIIADNAASSIKQGYRILVENVTSTTDLYYATVSYIVLDGTNYKIYLSEIEPVGTDTIDNLISQSGKIKTMWFSKYNQQQGQTGTTVSSTIISYNIINDYNLEEPFVYSIDDIDADIVLTSSLQTGNTAVLPLNTKKVIVCVDTQDGTVYVENTDYTIVNNVIDFGTTTHNDWVFIYIATITPSNTSYDIIKINDEYSKLRFFKNNEILGIADPSIKTSEGTSLTDIINVDLQYSTYKARTDTICLNSKGEIVRIRGQLTHYSETIVPEAPVELLNLGWVKFMPNQEFDKCIVNELKLKRTTMAEIKQLIEKVEKIEENQATLALEQEIKEGNLVTNLRGILADPLVDFSKIDTNNTFFNVGVNVVDNEMTLPSDDIVNELTWNDFTAKFNVESHKVILDDGTQIDKIVTLTILDDKVELLSNNNYTGSRNLNPYGAIKLPKVQIYPNKDNWIEEEITSDPTWSYRKELPVQFLQNKGTNTQVKVGIKPSQLRFGKSFPFRNVDTSFNKIDRKNSRNYTISERVSEYIRSKTITYSGSGFTPNATIEIYFETDRIATTTANTTGKINGSFTIPPNRYKTGNKKIKFVEIDLTNETFEKEAIVYYEATGIKRIYRKKNEIITQEPEKPKPPITRPPRKKCIKWSKKWVAKVAGAPSHYALFYDVATNPSDGEDWYYSKKCDEYITPAADPLAQTFKFDKDVILTGIKVIFTGIPTTSDAPDVFMNIGFTSNGYPDSETIFLTQFIKRDDINGSYNGSVYPYFIKFINPVYIPAGKEFFISLGSESTDYYVAISELGKEDLNTGEIVAKNGYLQGVLFSSSNATTWTAEQTKDLTFTLYTGEFSTEGYIQFAYNDTDNVYSFITNVNYDLPENTSIEASFSYDNAYWKPFNINDETVFDKTTNKFYVKYVFKGDGNLSPIVDLNDLGTFIVRKFDISNESWYVSESIEETPITNKITFIADLYENTANNVKIDDFMISDSDGNWTSLPTPTVSETDIGNGWKQKKYEFTLTSSITYFKVRFKLYGNTSQSPIIKNLRWILSE